MFTQTQSFHFNGPAEEVFAFLLRGGERQQYTDGEYTFVCVLATEPDFHSVITVAMRVGLIWTSAKGEGADPGAPEPMPHPCATLQLRLLQTRPGACIGKLGIHMTGVESLAATQELTTDQTEAAIRGFIAGHWRQMIACWEAYKRESTVVTAPSRSRGGRPRYPEDDWAYHQIAVLGRPRPEVYREWLRRIGERAKTLADPQDSFRRAMVARRE